MQGAALDCKKAHPSCSKCRQQAISKGSSAKETVCTACKAGWALRAGSNKICGESRKGNQCLATHASILC